MVNDEGVLCDGSCCTWYHRNCMGIMKDHYDNIVVSATGYDKCFFPFCDSAEEHKSSSGNTGRHTFKYFPENSE